MDILLFLGGLDLYSLKSVYIHSEKGFFLLKRDIGGFFQSLTIYD